MAETIRTVSLAEETQQRYLNYAMSVVTARALPDVRDGLKPVQRRILYTMYHNLHLHFDGRPRKCAKIVGDVAGNYHPHGTVPVYDALVRLAQNWVMSEPLVVGQGNFGSVDGDPPAAERYTEARLAAISDTLMSELRQNTVRMRPNYENTTEEPVVLPAQYPNLLVNGASGIAVGLATNIPPHNLGEVIRACMLLIDNPDATTAEVMNKVKGPDFPLGGRIITDRPTLRKIYEDGQGTIKVQSEWKVETSKDKKKNIIVHAIPYGVNKGKLESDIGEIIAARKLPQLLNVTNGTNEKDGLRIVLEIKKDADPELVMAYLFRHTALQSNFSVNLTCLVPVYDEEQSEEDVRHPVERLQPARLGLKAILQHFLEFRLLTVRHRLEHELEVLLRRIHILEGFQIIFNALDEALKMIRESSGKADAAERLIAAFKLSQEQANAVLEAQIYKIAQMEIQKILDELKEKKAEAKRIQKILRSEKEQWKLIKGELTALEDKHSQRRRTRLGSSDDTLEFDPNAYVVRENTNVILTRNGWIKRVGRLQSVAKTKVREGDEVIAVVPGNTLEQVVFFADDGSAYTMPMNDVPASTGYGEPITKFFRLADQVSIIDATTTDDRFQVKEKKGKKGLPPSPYLLVATAQGQVLRVPFSTFRVVSTKAGRRFVRLTEGDKVVLATVLTGEEESMFLATKAGRVIHFPVSDVNVLSGVGKGVLGIKLDKKDECLGGAVISNRHDALVVETTGNRTMEFRRGKYTPTSRGGKGFEAVKRTNFQRVIRPEIELVDWDAIEENDRKNSNGKKKPQQRGLFDN